MNSQVLKILALNVVLLFLFKLSWGATENPQKTYHKDFTVNKDVKMVIDNRFGLVQITTGNQNTVTVDVRVWVEGEDPDKAQKILDKIDVSIKGDAKKVSAITEINGNINNHKNSKLHIDYKVSMPVTAHLDLTHKFGDAYISNLTGPATIDLEYGNITAQRFENTDNSLEIKFSKGSVEYMKSGKLDLEYSTLTLKGADHLNAETQFSTFTMTAVGQLKLDSQYDTDNFEAIGSVRGESHFSTVSIGALADTLNLDTEYGELTVDKLSKNFQYVKIDNSFGSITLNLVPSTSFAFKGDASFGDISFPDGAEIKTENGMTSHSYEGRVGTNPKGYMDLDTSYGSIKVR